MRVAALLLASVALVPPTSACLPCNDAPCFSALRVSVTEHERAALEPGTWELVFVVDEEVPLRATCEIGPDSRSAACEDMDIVVRPMIFGGMDQPYSQLQIDFEGGDGTEGLPSLLGVTITHEGDVVFEDELEPEYTRREPKRCDPDCFDDSIHIDVVRE